MAKFSKQDYVSIARVIDDTWSKLYALASGDAERQWGVLIDMQTVVTAFADMFEQDNDRFDRERFVLACEGAWTEEPRPTAAEARQAHRCDVGDDNCSRCGAPAWWEGNQ